MSPFLISCSSGNLQLVELLAKKEAQLQLEGPYSMDLDGARLAWQKGHLDVVIFLMENMKEVYHSCWDFFRFLKIFFQLRIKNENNLTSQIHSQ